MTMSAAKFHGEYNGLTSVARKVYEAVPSMEEWASARIQTELRRVGVAMDAKQVNGCLGTLVRSGLVREPKPGMFIRQYVKDAPQRPALVKSAPIEPKPEVAPVPEEAPIDKLSCLSQKLRDLARNIVEVADAVDNAAIEIADRISSESEETGKLKQLQKLLKELG